MDEHAALFVEGGINRHGQHPKSKAPSKGKSGTHIGVTVLRPGSERYGPAAAPDLTRNWLS